MYTLQLNAFLRRVSDTTLICLTLSIVGTLAGCWYLWWYVPLRTSYAVLSKQAADIHKRTNSLKKRLERSSWVSQELDIIEKRCLQQAEQLSEEVAMLIHLLDTIKQSGVHLLTWQPEQLKIYEYYVIKPVVSELLGTYEELIKIVSEVSCQHLTFTKTAQGIHATCIFELFCRKERPKRSV